MTDPDLIPLAHFVPARNLSLDQEADSLLTVIASLLQTLQDAQCGSVDSTLQLHAAKQIFRECVESLCRPLSQDQTQDLLILTVITLCERLADSCLSHDG